MGKQIPMVEYLALGDEPHLIAQECKECGALYFDRRNACAKCGARKFGSRDLAPTGVIRSFSIIHQAAPGVPVPYVSSIVDLDGGGSVKANVMNAEPDPDHVKLGMKVRLATFVAGTDDDGTEAIAFAFEPVG
ncbi:MAG: OB-fold domain-containing protein [Acidimicrobiia bacterium]